MSPRAGEWHLFDGYDSDPIPASEYDVDELAQEMRQRSNDAGDMKSVLHQLADLNGWRGDAADAFAEKADEVVGDLGKVVDRYDKVADALYKWGDDVRTARHDTQRALDKAEEASRTIANNAEYTGTGDPPDGQDATDSRREDAEIALAEARSMLNDAMSALEDAADRARNDIGDAADIWDDGWWGDVKGWVRDHADLIAGIVSVLEWVAIGLAAAILVLGIIFTGGALLAALIAVSVGVGLLTAGLQATLLPAVSGRLGNLRQIAKFNQLVDDLGGGALNRIMTGLSGKMGPGMTKWANGQLDDLANIANRAGSNLAQNIDDFGKLNATKLQALLNQGRDLANLRETVRSLNALRSLSLSTDELAQLGNITKNLNLAVGSNVAANLNNLNTLIAKLTGINTFKFDFNTAPVT